MNTLIPERVKYLLVDLNTFLREYSDNQVVINLSPKFPFKALITTLLTFNQYLDDRETIWFEIENRFKDEIDNFNFDILEICLDALVLELDEFIRDKAPQSIDTGEFIIDKWVDHTTILLKHDETAGMYRDNWPPEASQPWPVGYPDALRDSKLYY